MSIKYESWFSTILGLSLNSTDTVITLGVAPTVTNGRMYIFDWTQKEWVDFTGVSGVTITWCTRNVSKTADPMTGGTGYNFNAGTPVVLVAMHDQLPDKTTANTFVGNQTITGDLSVSGDITVDEASFIKGSFATSYASTALRDAALGANGVATHPYQSILAGGLFYNYNTTTAQRESIDTGTATPPATTTTLGTVELATQTEVNNGTNTWGAGPVVVQPAELKVVTDAILVPLYFGSGGDGDVTINSGTTTLTRDMYYNNLTLTSPWVLNPNGYRVFVKWTFSGTGTVSRTGNAGSAGTIWLMWSAGAAWAWWAALNAWSLGMELVWAAWWAWWYAPAVDQVWVAWVAWTATNPSMTNISSVAWWAWWAANAISWWAWWAAAAATRWALYNYVSNPATLHQATATYAALAYKWMPSWGWGWGGWADYTSGTASWGWGGWAGSSWWFIYIWATTWNFTWTVTAVWWAGWAGWAWLNNAPSWWWWGWAWGNWGILFRAYRTLSGDCTKTLTWWAGWAAWAWAAWWSTWTAGTAWTTWETISIVI